MKKIILMMLLLASSIMADITISTGEKSKSFNKMGERTSQIINRKDVSVITSKGSLENIDNLISGKANVAFAFADSYMYKKASDPRAEDLKIVGTVGKGCLYAVAKKKGKVDSSSDLETSGVIVDSGKVGAGSNTTWSYLGELDSDFKKPTTQNIGGDMALSAVISGQIDVTLQMQAPSTENNLVKDVLANKDLKFVPFKNWSFNSKLPNGKAVYTKETIVLEKGFISTTLDTVCTDTLVLANKNLSDDDLDLVAGIILRNQKAILGEK